MVKNGRAKEAVHLDFEAEKIFIERGEKAPAPRWLIEPLVPSTGSLMLAGPPGAGKTWLCLAIAKIGALAGRSSLFIEEEGSAHSLSERMKATGFGNGGDEFATIIEVLHRKSFRLDTPGYTAALCAKMVPMDAPIVILDPLASLWIGDENSTKDVSRLVVWLQCLRNFEDALIIVVTHTSKGATNAALRGEVVSGVYSARGSSVLPGWFDTILNIDEAKGAPGTIALSANPVKCRELDGAKKMVVTITLGTGEIELSSGPKTARINRREQAMQVINQNPGWTRSEVYDLVGGNKMNLWKIISELVSERLVADREGRLFYGNGTQD